jgi:hypothetical protein
MRRLAGDGMKPSRIRRTGRGGIEGAIGWRLVEVEQS